jgi:hypothetical protein
MFPNLDRYQAVERGAGGHKRDGSSGHSPARPEHEVRLVKAAFLERPRPYRFSKPILRGFDSAAMREHYIVVGTLPPRPATATLRHV